MTAKPQAYIVTVLPCSLLSRLRAPIATPLDRWTEMRRPNNCARSWTTYIGGVADLHLVRHRHISQAQHGGFGWINFTDAHYTMTAIGESGTLNFAAICAWRRRTR